MRHEVVDVGRHGVPCEADDGACVLQGRPQYLIKMDVDNKVWVIRGYVINGYVKRVYVEDTGYVP